MDLKARSFEINNYRKDNRLMTNNTNRKKPGYFYAVNGEYGTLIQCAMDFGDPKFPDIQIACFQISRSLAWAPLGPTLGPGCLGLTQLGPSLGLQPWALLEPSLKPLWAQGPGWVQLGSKALGLAWAHLGPSLGKLGPAWAT